MKKKLCVDYISQVLADGKPAKLIDIVQAVQAAGWKSSLSSKYINVYHELREHPQLFERVNKGYYRLKRAAVFNKPVDRDDLKDTIIAIARRRPLLTATQIWRTLQRKGIFITYRDVYYILKTDKLVVKNNKLQYRIM